jgi:GntR family transcriptional regulator, transcriptional repressor for pyruvate dehydrogenase complex
LSATRLSSAARYAVFAPLDGGGRSEAVARRLSEVIALGLVADGEQLPSETELASQLNVSTVTLREALSTLRNRGLIETRRGRGGGSFVRAADPSAARIRERLRQLTVHELREICDHHTAISGMAARLAAERASADNVTRLISLTARLADATTVGGRRRADARFHIEVSAAAQSARLTRQEIDLQAEVGELLWLPLSEAVIQEEAVHQHRSIAEAIERREGDLARQRAEEHIEHACRRLIAFHFRLAES